ncbi:FtsB family cell division protein [Micropruina glycogenica]|jgi:cell division protein FtsB|uniref:Cell division protein FtsB n=1 Tax=Micropruina glycogenica TaxID=75385 RepID=A0A2N9JLM4_9ACTN
MARDKRPRTSTAGPGRTSRTRAGSRASTPKSVSTPSAQAVDDAPKTRRRLPALPTRFALTRRALAVFSVLVILTLSYANSLRIYLEQQRDLGEAQQQIAQRTAQISDLQDELNRWNDPAFVKAQARDRLGWLLPGEKGFKVIGPDGKPLGTGVVLDSQTELPPGEHSEMWFDRLWGSVQTADNPERGVGR